MTFSIYFSEAMWQGKSTKSHSVICLESSILESLSLRPFIDRLRSTGYFGYRTGIIIIFILNDNEQGLYYKNASKAESD